MSDPMALKPPTETTLPGRLAREISRVTALRGRYEALQSGYGLPHMGPAIFMMTKSIEAAIKAADSSDIYDQILAVSALQGYKS